MKSNCTPSRLRGVLLLLTLAAACKREEAPKPRAAPKPETPVADKAIAESEDVSWLAGTWKKDGAPRWLLFNLPGEVAELAGKPPGMVRRGRLSVQGRYLSAIFADGTYELEATTDHAALSGAPGVYRRGSPP